jgi:hypothetical protein
MFSWSLSVWPDELWPESFKIYPPSSLRVYPNKKKKLNQGNLWKWSWYKGTYNRVTRVIKE